MRRKIAIKKIYRLVEKAKFEIGNFFIDDFENVEGKKDFQKASLFIDKIWNFK